MPFFIDDTSDESAASIELYSQKVTNLDSVGYVHRVHTFMDDQLQGLGVGEQSLAGWKFAILFVLAVVICAVIWWVSRRLMIVFLDKLVNRTKAKWDDILVKHHVFAKFAHLIPAYFLGEYIPYLFRDYPDLAPAAYWLLNIAIVVIIIRALGALANGIFEILGNRPGLRDKPMLSYAQLTRLIINLIGGVLIVSILFDKSPVYFFSAMGAMTAILLLIFKDAILGFVASIQIAANDMVRTGDWVTMEKYGADGDVEQITLTTVKVRNFDHTITTIPTYAFISDSFRNWRGMQESDGRRIKRAIKIDVSSIKFATPEMIQRYKAFHLVKDYIAQRQEEIDKWNAEKQIDTKGMLNGRRMTNLGIFRAYLTNYLKQNQHINTGLTLMVRQLEPTEHGVPLEVYVFSKDTVWARYEQIIADIFDHVFAAVPQFDLELFQEPSGNDVRHALEQLKGNGAH